MQFQIFIEPGARRFTATHDQTVLDAALAAGVRLPHGCRDGICGACKARILEGRVTEPVNPDAPLSDAQRREGMALLCQAHPQSDLRVHIEAPPSLADLPVRRLPCRVVDLQRAAEDVMLLTLKLPGGAAFDFRPGQYVDILLADGRRRSFSIANRPGSGEFLELHIRRIPGGFFSAQVFERLQVRDLLRLEGPLGHFFLREDSPRPIVLLAGGTGFAPIKSIIEQAIARPSPRPMTLYWGARARSDLYLETLARSWEGVLPGFRFVPVLSEPRAEDRWTGRLGLVHHALMEDWPDLSGHEVYACGAPAMIAAARHDLSSRCRLHEDAFFADAFAYADNSNR